MDIHYTEEILNGEKILLMPRPAPNHQYVVNSVEKPLSKYFKNKKCFVFQEIDVVLTEKDRVVPDLCVICDMSKFSGTMYYGSPELIAEVLSLGTTKRDMGYKKDLYEKTGVFEYWVVRIQGKEIMQYCLEKGKYKLFDVYTYLEKSELEFYKKENFLDIPQIIKSCRFPDIRIDLVDIFGDLPLPVI